ncbi:hypothetical protein MVEN_02188100 [Mycena venus]|uniref:Uncharacterized protein n=1 Tax=Mycena venus TaxID=2733690 RepID=A0A8H6X9E0_9AGAR|nr:hypothetical protein MVEN_02188100 [Mycena venus]
MANGRKTLSAEEKAERRELKAKEKALEEQRLIAAGNDRRKSKEKAYENTVWTKGKIDEQNGYDASKGRKRASSTAKSSEKTKKSKRCQPQGEQERLSEEEEEIVPSKPKRKSRPPPPAIIDESDEESPAHGAKPTAKTSRATSTATGAKSKKSKKSNATVMKQKPNIIAEGVSDDSTEDDESQSDASDEDSEGDKEGDDEEGGSVASAQLNRERPQILNRRRSSASMSKRAESDCEMHNPSKPDGLFSDAVIVHRGDNAPDYSDEDVPIPSVPRRSTSRASSIRSFSSGADNVPDTDYDGHPDEMHNEDVDMEEYSDEKESVTPPPPPPPPPKKQSIYKKRKRNVDIYRSQRWPYGCR